MGIGINGCKSGTLEEIDIRDNLENWMRAINNGLV